MNMSIPGIAKAVSLSFALLATLTFGHTVAKADEVFVSGHTNGCFATPGVPCVPINNPNPHVPPPSLFGLTYQNSTFQGVTANGFLAFGCACDTSTTPGSIQVWTPSDGLVRNLGC